MDKTEDGTKPSNYCENIKAQLMNTGIYIGGGSGNIWDSPKGELCAKFGTITGLWTILFLWVFDILPGSLPLLIIESRLFSKVPQIWHIAIFPDQEDSKHSNEQ